MQIFESQDEEAIWLGLRVSMLVMFKLWLFSSKLGPSENGNELGSDSFRIMLPDFKPTIKKLTLGLLKKCRAVIESSNSARSLNFDLVVKFQRDNFLSYDPETTHFSSEVSNRHDTCLVCP